MAQFHEVEHFAGAKIRESVLPSRRVYAGKPTIVTKIDDRKLKVLENGRERLIEVDGIRSPQIVFRLKQYGKNISIEWREK